MISFKEFLLEKTVQYKTDNSEGSQDQIFNKAKQLALNAYVKNANKNNPEVKKTIKDAPDRIKNAKDKSELMNAISSWASGANPIYKGAYQTIKSLKPTDDEGADSENAQKEKVDKPEKPNEETSKETENDNEENNKENAEEQGAEDLHNSTEQVLANKADEKQQKADEEKQKEIEDNKSFFDDFGSTEEKDDYEQAEAEMSLSQQFAEDNAYNLEIARQEDRKKFLEALGNLISLIFDGANTDSITDRAERKIEQLKQKQSAEQAMKEMEERNPDGEQKVKNKYDNFREGLKNVVKSRENLIKKQPCPAVVERAKQYSEARKKAMKDIKDRIAEKYGPNSNDPEVTDKQKADYQKYKDLSNKKLSSMTPDEKKEFNDLDKTFGPDAELAKWEENNKFDEERAKEETKKWREEQLEDLKRQYELKQEKIDAAQEKEMADVKIKKLEMQRFKEEYFRKIDKGLLSVDDQDKFRKMLTDMYDKEEKKYKDPTAKMKKSNEDDKKNIEELENLRNQLPKDAPAYIRHSGDPEEIQDWINKHKKNESYREFVQRKKLYEQKLDKKYKKLLKSIL